MKIEIKTLMPIPEMPTEVEMERGTLRDLFLKVFQQVHFSKEIIDQEAGTFKEDGIFDARLNGTSYHNLPKGIDTDLSDGDTVILYLMILGGG
jgi:hypothetical protein